MTLTKCYDTIHGLWGSWMLIMVLELADGLKKYFMMGISYDFMMKRVFIDVLMTSIYPTTFIGFDFN